MSRRYHLERSLRRALVYPALRLVLRRRRVDSPLDIARVRKLLILRHDRIGDMIVSTPILSRLKEANPRLRLGVFASPANAEIIRHHPAVDRIHVAHPNWLRLVGEIRRARQERYDVVLNFVFNRTTSVALLARLAAPRAITVGQGPDEYRHHFNRLLKLERTTVHMVDILADYLRQVFELESDPERLRLEIAVDDGSRRAVDRFLERHALSRRRPDGTPGGAVRGAAARGGARRETTSSPYAVFNLSATDAQRRLSFEQAVALGARLARSEEVSVVLISAPVDRELARSVAAAIASRRCVRFPEDRVATLLEVASLIEGAACVFTPDTSIVHFAAAMQTPIMGFFSPLQDHGEWRPYGVRSVAVLAPAGSPVSSIPAEMMVGRAGAFLRSLELAPPGGARG